MIGINNAIKRTIVHRLLYWIDEIFFQIQSTLFRPRKFNVYVESEENTNKAI